MLTAPGLLADLAAWRGEEVWFVEAMSGTSHTYRDLDGAARRFARSLDRLGISPGDTVATMLPHSADTYRLWFGIALAGAFEVPISTRYRGRMLEHILDDAGARLLVIDNGLVDAIVDAVRNGRLPKLATIIVRGDAERSVQVDGVTTVRLDDLDDADPGADDPGRPAPNFHDIATVLYTSGTTGPSKGVLVPWGQIHATVTGVFPEGTFDTPKVLYCPFPPNHIGGRLFPCLALLRGIPVVVRDTFSASNYWPDVRRFGCTTTALVPAMASILWNALAVDDDRDNPLQDVAMVPIIPEHKGFRERFGVRICTDYNMTEISIPTVSGWEIDDWRSCGKVRPGPPGYELRVVDEHDDPVPPGATGELVCRTSDTSALNAGYLGRPTETAHAWRNGWFHTGDAFRVDVAGRYYFVDRIKDAIRRRGENVSSFEVEREVLDHPDVAECAAIGVPSELGEEDIKVFVVLRHDSELAADALIEYLRPRCPTFMVPRYVEFLEELPRTDGTLKVKKAELRARQPPPAAD